jgi:hypothetical protein
MTQDSDEYPSVRKALLGNGHAANLYCGVKWLFWQLTHVILAGLILAGGAIVAVAIIPLVAYELFTDYVTKGRIAAKIPKLASRGPSITFTETHAKRLVQASLTFAVIAIGVNIAFLFIQAPILFLATVGLITILGIGLAAEYMLWTNLVRDYLSEKKQNSAQKFEQTRQKSEQTAVTRRVLGYCPVSMDIDPKWYEGLKKRLL